MICDNDINTIYVFSTLDWACESEFSSGEYCGASLPSAQPLLMAHQGEGPSPPAPGLLLPDNSGLLK